MLYFGCEYPETWALSKQMSRKVPPRRLFAFRRRKGIWLIRPASASLVTILGLITHIPFLPKSR